MTDWNLVASFVGAASSIVLAAVGVATYRANRDLVSNASRQADLTRLAVEAAQAEAAASGRQVDELILDRKLAIQPFLVFVSHASLTADRPAAGGHAGLRVQNIGKGPALSCHYAARMPTIDHPPDPVTFLHAGPFAVGPGDSPLVGPFFTKEGNVVNLLAGLIVVGQAEQVEVLLCRDTFANKYRFSSLEALPDVSPQGEREPPSWTLGW